MSAYVLTPSGSQAAENTAGRGPTFAVLSLLYESTGSLEFEEIMDGTGMDQEKASMVVNKLISDGYVKEA